MEPEPEGLTRGDSVSVGSGLREVEALGKKLEELKGEKVSGGVALEETLTLELTLGEGSIVGEAEKELFTL